MTIPTASNFPNSFDNDDNLFLVHDALRVVLAEDYSPGDVTVTTVGDSSVFPPTGIITLTEQCSDIEDRAISLYYGSKTATTFNELELLPEFTDVVKPKNVTNVTLNVLDKHHNHIKDAIIAMEEFIGVKGTTDTAPGGSTLEGRLNFLRNLILSPKAWFTANKRVGLVPLCVTFTDQSFRLGSGSVIFLWDFGDQTVSTVSTISTISTVSVVPVDQVNVVVQDTDGGTIEKCYTEPGLYDVKLTVTNDYGQDVVEFKEMINARIEAPAEAQIEFTSSSGQTLTASDYDADPVVPPTIKSPTNKIININIPSGKNAVSGCEDSGTCRSYAGELLDATDSPIDPITQYTWALGDDLEHPSLTTAKASYSIGGIYDLTLRVDTTFGSYRITTYEDVIDIVEDRNLWLWTHSTSSVVNSFEFGLLSETFKTTGGGLTITRDGSFIEDDSSLSEDVKTQATTEFERNTGFTPRGTNVSGGGGTALMYWASGGTTSDALTSHTVKVSEYNGFSDTYISHSDITNKPWNWAFLSSLTKSYFFFGQNPTATAFTNPSYQIKTTLSLTDLTSTDDSITSSYYKNGADELKQHVSNYDDSGASETGYFAVYRTTYKDDTGYIARNDGVGTFFRIKSFYKTEGTVALPFQTIRKLPDIAGVTKVEGQLVSLTNGVFFFDNSGNISAYNTASGVWETGGPSSKSVSFRSVQDINTTGFDSPANTLLAASDGDRVAYLSYDYSRSAFIKFNGQDVTFTNVITRPAGTQFMMGIY